MCLGGRFGSCFAEEVGGNCPETRSRKVVCNSGLTVSRQLWNAICKLLVCSAVFLRTWR